MLIVDVIHWAGTLSRQRIESYREKQSAERFSRAADVVLRRRMPSCMQWVSDAVSELARCGSVPADRNERPARISS